MSMPNQSSIIESTLTEILNELPDACQQLQAALTTFNETKDKLTELSNPDLPSSETQTTLQYDLQTQLQENITLLSTRSKKVKLLKAQQEVLETAQKYKNAQRDLETSKTALQTARVEADEKFAIDKAELRACKAKWEAEGGDDLHVRGLDFIVAMSRGTELRWIKELEWRVGDRERELESLGSMLRIQLRKVEEVFHEGGL